MLGAYGKAEETLISYFLSTRWQCFCSDSNCTVFVCFQVSTCINQKPAFRRRYDTWAPDWYQNLDEYSLYCDAHVRKEAAYGLGCIPGRCHHGVETVRGAIQLSDRLGYDGQGTKLRTCHVLMISSYLQ